MKFIIFIIAFLTSMFLIPHQSIADFVMHHIQIRGDGEEGMDNFETVVMIISAVIALIIAFIITRLFLRIKTSSKNN